VLLDCIRAPFANVVAQRTAPLQLQRSTKPAEHLVKKERRRDLALDRRRHLKSMRELLDLFKALSLPPDEKPFRIPITPRFFPEAVDPGLLNPYFPDDVARWYLDNWMNFVGATPRGLNAPVGTDAIQDFSSEFVEPSAASGWNTILDGCPSLIAATFQSQNRRWPDAYTNGRMFRTNPALDLLVKRIPQSPSFPAALDPRLHHQYHSLLTFRFFRNGVEASDECCALAERK